MAQQSARRGRKNQGFPPCHEHAIGEVVPVRELPFVGLILLLIFPRTLNTMLNAAGIVEINNGLVVWKGQLVKTGDQLKIANDTITTLRADQQKLLLTLTQLTSTHQGAKQEAAVKAAEAVVRRTDSAALQVQNRVQATLRTNAPLVATVSQKGYGAAPPQSAICYQELNPAKPPQQRYSVHCHSSPAVCETARGPNARTVQSGCLPTALAGASWTPRHPGFLGSWYDEGPGPFDAPFPVLPPH